MKKTFHKLVDIVNMQSTFDSRMGTLGSKVDVIDDKLSTILSFLQNPDAKKEEKVVSTKCIPKLVLRKDDENTGNYDENGGNKQVKGTSGAAMVTSTSPTQTQSHTKQSAHVSGSGVKIVTPETLTKSQIC